MRKFISKFLVATVLVGGSFFATANADDKDVEFDAPFEKESAKTTPADKDAKVAATLEKELEKENRTTTPTDKDAKVTATLEKELKKMLEKDRSTPNAVDDTKIPAPSTNESTKTPASDRDAKVTATPANESAITPANDNSSQPKSQAIAELEWESGTENVPDEYAATEEEIIAMLQKDGGTPYPIGQRNIDYAEYFTGRVFLYPISSDGVNVVNVTFAPNSITCWHVHHGSSQVLSAVAGKGYYQIWGEPVRELLPGDNVTIPEGVKHWHGAQHNSWFQHISIMQVSATTEWLKPVNPNDYQKLRNKL